MPPTGITVAPIFLKLLGIKADVIGKEEKLAFTHKLPLKLIYITIFHSLCPIPLEFAHGQLF